MKHLWLVGIVLLTLPEASWARGWELHLLAGWTAPTFGQTFTYTPEPLPQTPVQGVGLQQGGMFELKARGNFAFGGGVTYFFNDSFGIEGRVDTVDAKIDSVLPTFSATLGDPGRSPLGVTLDLGRGFVDVERLFPLSLNVKGRFGEGTSFIVSAGMSYLPRLRFNATQTIGLGVVAFGQQLDIATIDIRAAGGVQDEGQLGGNFGLGVEVPLNDNVRLIGEARAFLFQSRTFQWRPPENATPIDAFLLQGILNDLQPIEFSPAYFHVTAGIVIRLQ